MSEEIKKPQIVLRPDGVLEIIDPRYKEPAPEEKAERKKFGARCGHIKRRILNNERLTGELLELALEIAGGDHENSPKEAVSIAAKLRDGRQLSEYEQHLMVDVFLLHARLGS